MQDNNHNNNNLAVQQPQQLAKYEPKYYVAVLSESNILEACQVMIDKALLFKGNNKTENEASLMAVMLKEKIQKSYSHLTLEQIDETLFDNNYGEGFGVSVLSLVSALEKSELHRQSLENKRKIIEREREEEMKKIHEFQQQEREKQNTPEARKQKVNGIYKEWLEGGKLHDYNNECFGWIIENELYDWSAQEREKAKRIATTRTKEIFRQMKARAEKSFDFEKVKQLQAIVYSTLEEQELFDKFNKEELTLVYFNVLKQKKLKKQTE